MPKKFVERLKKVFEPSEELKAQQAASRAERLRYLDNFELRFKTPERKAELATQLSRIATNRELIVVAGVRTLASAERARDKIVETFAAEKRQLGFLAMRRFEPAKSHWEVYMEAALNNVGIELTPEDVYLGVDKVKYSPGTDEYAQNLVDASLERAITQYYAIPPEQAPDALILMVSGTTMPIGDGVNDVTEHFHGLEYEAMSSSGGSAAILIDVNHAAEMRWRQL